MKEPTGEREPISIGTRMKFAAPPERVWSGMIYFEQISSPPPWVLRLLLPVPLRTEGRKSQVGDEANCLYRVGHLQKRVTLAERCRHYAFEIVEQNLAFGGGIQLLGGSYSLRALPGGSTELELRTRYLSRRRPHWLWKRLEAAVCHEFHRHILNAMKRDVESGEPIA